MRREVEDDTTEVDGAKAAADPASAARMIFIVGECMV